MFMNRKILAEACNFLLTRLQIIVTWVSKPSLLFKLIPKSFLLLLFLMTLWSILIEKNSSVLNMRWHLQVFSFKKLFKNLIQSYFSTSSSFSRLTSTFWEHTYEVLSSTYHIISASQQIRISQREIDWIIAILKLILVERLGIYPDVSQNWS